jgi:hypothetical protein
MCTPVQTVVSQVTRTYNKSNKDFPKNLDKLVTKDNKNQKFYKSSQ